MDGGGWGPLRKRQGEFTPNTASKRGALRKVVENVLNRSDKDMIQYHCEEENVCKLKESLNLNKDLMNKERLDHFRNSSKSIPLVRVNGVAAQEDNMDEDDDDSNRSSGFYVSPMFGEKFLQFAPRVFLSSQVAQICDETFCKCKKLSDYYTKYAKYDVQAPTMRLQQQQQQQQPPPQQQQDGRWMQHLSRQATSCGDAEPSKESSYAEPPVKIVCQVLHPLGDGIKSAIKELESIHSTAAHDALVVLETVSGLLTTVTSSLCSTSSCTNELV